MGLLGSLSGGGRRRQAHRQRFLSIVGAAASLEKGALLRLSEKAGIVFRPIASPFFDNLDSELRDMLRASGREGRTRYEIRDDSYGTRWIVLDERRFEELVPTVLAVTDSISEHGLSGRLLAAAFKFQYEGKDAYWVYHYKRAAMHPFIPSGESQRDNANEMRLAAAMREQKVPVEPNLELWYALWGIPF